MLTVFLGPFKVQRLMNLQPFQSNKILHSLKQWGPSIHPPPPPPKKKLQGWEVSPIFHCGEFFVETSFSLIWHPKFTQVPGHLYGNNLTTRHQKQPAFQQPLSFREGNYGCFCWQKKHYDEVKWSSPYQSLAHHQISVPSPNGWHFLVPSVRFWDLPQVLLVKKSKLWNAGGWNLPQK